MDLQNLAEKAKNLVDEVTTRAPQFLEDDTEVVSPGGRREIIFIPRDPSEVTPRRAVFLGCVLTCLAVACIIGIGQYFGWWALLKQKCLTFWSYIRRNNDNSSATKDVLAIEAGIGKPEALETEVPEAIQNLELEAVEVDPQPEALGVDPRPSALEADAPPPAIEVEILEKIQGPPARLAICHEKWFFFSFGLVPI